jgi:hypothetical protein
MSDYLAYKLLDELWLARICQIPPDMGIGLFKRNV